MKRLKQLLVIGLAVVMAFAFSACGKKDDTTTSKTLSSISVDSSAAKTEYTVGESFSSDGIVVTATYDDATTATIASGSYTVDSSAYKSSTAGTYSITVSYTESEVTKTASYSVTVAEADVDETDTGYGGLYITKTTTDYTVSSADGVTVSTDDLSVYLVDEEGNVSSTALSSGYTLKYYKEDVELESLSNLTEGKYQIWAYYANPYSDEPAQLSNFIFINVADTVASIALSNAETGKFTQAASSTDELSPTWEFTLTYSSGITETVDATDSNVVITDLSTLSAVTNAVATVTYTKVDANGTETVVSCTVTYTITEASTGAQTYTYNFNTLTASVEAGTAIIDGVLYTIGTPGYGTNSRTHSDLADETIKGRLQINGTENGFKLTLTSAATITVYAQSSSSSEERAIALYDYTNDTKGDMVGTSAAVGVSTDKNELNKCVFTVDAAGTYCLFTTGSSANIFYIIVEVGGSSSSSADSINLNTLTASVEAGTAIIDGVVYTIGTPGYGTNSRTHSDLADETIKGRLQINGTENGFKILLTSAATITVYAQSSSSSEERAIALYDYTNDTKGDMVGTSAAVGVSTDKNELNKCVFTVDAAGAYCLFTTGSSANVFYIIIEY